MKTKKLIAITIIVSLLYVCVIQGSFAKEDDLIIQDDGNIELVIIDNGVLGTSTTPVETEKASTPQSTHPQEQNNPPEHTENTHTSPSSPTSSPTSQPEKTVPLVSPHAETTVQINPPINNGKEVQVIITTQTTQPPQSIPSSSNNPQSSLPTITNATDNHPPTVITKNVSQVVAQGANGKPVITIKSEKAHELTIQQGTTQVTTFLPIQINTLTHSLAVPTANKPTTINVLPSEALQGILDNNILNAQSLSKTTINLTKDTNSINYTVNSQKQGKLFGIYPVQSPIQIKLSAQNGKIVTSSQSVLFSVLGWFIK